MQHSLNTPVGFLSITEENNFVTNISWKNEGDKKKTQIILELQEYFMKKRQNFDVKIKFKTGTSFQKRVWKELLNIPYGTIVTYGDIAKKLNSSPRAVGGAVGANPIPIIVPCHRVMGANSKLTGFSGGEGLPTKIKLLMLENIKYKK